jgi:hypothetical protein
VVAWGTQQPHGGTCDVLAGPGWWLPQHWIVVGRRLWWRLCIHLCWHRVVGMLLIVAGGCPCGLGGCTDTGLWQELGRSRVSGGLHVGCWCRPYKGPAAANIQGVSGCRGWCEGGVGRGNRPRPVTERLCSRSYCWLHELATQQNGGRPLLRQSVQPVVPCCGTHAVAGCCSLIMAALQTLSVLSVLGSTSLSGDTS